MVTGRKAFDGSSSASVVAAILGTQPPPVSTLRPLTPSALEHAVMTCLAKDPDQRWQAAGDPARQLRWIAESDAQASSRIATATTTGNHRGVLILAAIGLVAAGVMGALVWSRIYGRTTVPLQVTRSILMAANPVPHDLALSPDGTRLAYSAERNGRSHIYVQSLNEFDATAIAGTEYPCCPYLLAGWAVARLL